MATGLAIGVAERTLTGLAIGLAGAGISLDSSGNGTTAGVVQIVSLWRAGNAARLAPGTNRRPTSIEKSTMTGTT
jgi:hypothetical protein